MRPLLRLACLVLGAGYLPAEAAVGACRVDLGAETARECEGRSCKCLSVRNGCPYPVNVSYETGAGQKTMRVEASVASGDACAFPVWPSQANFLGWRPVPGYPRFGHPVPLDGNSLKGPAAGAD